MFMGLVVFGFVFSSWQRVLDLVELLVFELVTRVIMLQCEGKRKKFL